MSDPLAEPGSTEHMQLQKIRSLLMSGLMSADPGQKITKLEFTYNADKNIETLVTKQGSQTLFTLTFAYNADKEVESITRS